MLKSIVLLVLLSLTMPLYAEDKASCVVEGSTATFTQWLNSRPYTIQVNEKEERKKIREQWRQFFGLDFFLAYFNFREMEDKVEYKSRIKFLRLHGKAKIEEDETKYIFKMEF